MVYRTRKLAALLLASALMLVAVPMAAAATQNQDGLVNVAIGDITIEDVNVGVAAQIAATICGVKVGPVAVLGVAVDRSGDSTTVCTINQRDVTITQN